MTSDPVPETLEHVPEGDDEFQPNHNLEEEDMAFFSEEDGSVPSDSDSESPGSVEVVCFVIHYNCPVDTIGHNYVPSSYFPNVSQNFKGFITSLTLPYPCNP